MPSGPCSSSRLTRVCKPRRFIRSSTSGRRRTCSRSGFCRAGRVGPHGAILALADCALQAPDEPWIGRTLAHALDTYRNDPDPGIHAAARLLLQRGGRSRDVRQIDDGLEGAGVRGQGAGMSKAGTRWS